ncbi:hypothetical protein WJX79_005683 [Trebouxia sp. C0005]
MLQVFAPYVQSLQGLHSSGHQPSAHVQRSHLCRPQLFQCRSHPHHEHLIQAHVCNSQGHAASLAEPFTADARHGALSEISTSESDMKRKSHILATRPAELLLPGVPGCEAAKQEVLSLVSQTLTRFFPDRFQLKNTILQNIATGEDFELADQDRNPMDVVARLVQEDIAVMQQINGRMILSCGAVVSPLGWSGSQKLGLDLKGIHSPVPHFNEGPALKFVTNIFEKGLNANVPLSRANWFIMDTAEHSLFAHPEHIPQSPDQGPITLENAGDRLFLRCERQVATRLPQCGGVMFSFKTYIRPLKALEQRTAVMSRLLAAFLALPDEVVAYRNVDSNTRQKAISYLQHITCQD